MEREGSSVNGVPARTRTWSFRLGGGGFILLIDGDAMTGQTGKVRHYTKKRVSGTSDVPGGAFCMDCGGFCLNDSGFAQCL